MHQRLTLVATLFVMTLGAAPARAAPTVQIELSASGYAPIVVSGTPDSLPNYSNASGPSIFGGYRLSVGVQGDSGILSFSAQINSVVTAQPITIAVTETGLVAVPGTVLSYESTNTAILKTNSMAAFSTYADPGDTAFALTSLLSSGVATGPTNGQSQVYTLGPFDGTLRVNGSYAMTKQVVFTPASSAARPTLDGQVSFAVPEPAGMWLLGVGLSALGVLARRRV